MNTDMAFFINLNGFCGLQGQNEDAKMLHLIIIFFLRVNLNALYEGEHELCPQFLVEMYDNKIGD